VERYQLDLLAAARQARTSMDAELRTLCSRQVPGDTQRNLEVDADYSGQTFKHILVPVWLVSYQFGRAHYQLVLNGHSGAIAGHYPKSWIKITFAALALLILVAALFYFFHHQAPV
jgi:hypothetical protein